MKMKDCFVVGIVAGLLLLTWGTTARINTLEASIRALAEASSKNSTSISTLADGESQLAKNQSLLATTQNQLAAGLVMCSKGIANNTESIRIVAGLPAESVKARLTSTLSPAR